MTNRRSSVGMAFACSLTALALAGCLGAAGESPASEPTPAPVAVPVTDEPGTLRGITSLYWGIAEPSDGSVLRLPLVFADETECKLLVASSGNEEGPGPNQVAIEETPNGGGWGEASSGSLAMAYAGPVDTRTLLPASGGWGAMSGASGTVQGEFTMTMLSEAVAPVEGSFAPGYAVAVSVECKGPFDVVGAKQGDQVALWSAENLQGVGASAFLVGSAAAAASASIDIASDDAGFYMGSFGFEAGEVQLEHPAGSDAWTLPLASSYALGGTSLHHLEDKAGTYKLTLTRVGGYIDVFWAGAYGFSGPMDLAKGLLAQSPIHDPFA